ncbi:MAG: hypothetical protein NT084_15615 [Bacteroidetes bacterium]|jgi:hypothetical protein|nr:hypothetical protein [Bacteroidota bacterium]
MSPSTRKKIIVISFIALYIAVGFFREFIFLNINEQSRVTFYHDNDSHVSDSMQWLSNFSYTTLYYAKWPLTLAFTALFAFLAGTTVKIAFGEKSLVKITWITYAAVFVTGILFYFAGSLSGNRESTYDIARFLAGMTETPAMLVILLASFLALRRQ